MRLISKREFKWEGIRHRKRRRLWRLGAASVLVLAVLGLGVFASGVVFASHNFSDVPTSAFYHSAVEWVFNRGITAGCAVGMYCPNDAVTRGTMAVFLRALGTALTPTFSGITVDGTGVAIDPDSNPIICSSPLFQFPITGYPRTVELEGEASFNPTGAMGISLRNVYSTDGGATWFNVGQPRSGSAETADHGFSLHDFSRFFLDVGATYRFGMRIGRAFGSADILGYTCQMDVMIMNRNGASSPLSPSR